MFNKYHAVKTHYNGRLYDSKKEAMHAATLEMMKRAVAPAQQVVAITPQYKMPLLVDGIKIGEYRADFHVTFADGHVEIQDVKGVKTDLYNWKKKHVAAQYKINIVEI